MVQAGCTFALYAWRSGSYLAEAGRSSPYLSPMNINSAASESAAAFLVTFGFWVPAILLLLVISVPGFALDTVAVLMSAFARAIPRFEQGARAGRLVKPNKSPAIDSASPDSSKSPPTSERVASAAPPQVLHHFLATAKQRRRSLAEAKSPAQASRKGRNRRASHRTVALMHRAEQDMTQTSTSES